MFVNPNTFDFSKAGYVDFTMKTSNANTSATDSDRFGLYLGYNTDATGMFIGYDNGGWFWQKYGASGNHGIRKAEWRLREKMWRQKFILSGQQIKK